MHSHLISFCLNESIHPASGQSVQRSSTALRFSRAEVQALPVTTHTSKHFDFWPVENLVAGGYKPSRSDGDLLTVRRWAVSGGTLALTLLQLALKTVEFGVAFVEFLFLII